MRADCNFLLLSESRLARVGHHVRLKSVCVFRMLALVVQAPARPIL
jgi:hypothetical protein